MAEPNESAIPDRHPVQIPHRPYGPQKAATIPKAVALVAYEVYVVAYGPQPAMVEGWCRGGFGAGELISFLYARSFPKEEWRRRVEEVICDMEGL